MLNTDNKATTTSPTTESLVVDRSVTIFLKENGSAYFKRNAKHMPEGKRNIGSGIRSVSRLKANMDEMDVYMPLILGMSRQDQNYPKRFADWCENISVRIPDNGKTLNIGFRYKDAESKKTILELEKQIYSDFVKADKSTSDSRDLAFDIRDRAITNLESTKYKYGLPVNVTDYIIWRYALVYRDVANDIALVNKHGGIRFYIYDSKQEKYKKDLQFKTRKSANTIYVKLFDEPTKAKNIMWNHMKNVNVDTMDESDIYGALEALVKVDPNELIKLYSDTNLVTKATIERLIHYGVLRRLDGTSVIVDEQNDTIGNDMTSVIAFFKNTERNKEAITRFTAKLRQYTGNNG